MEDAAEHLVHDALPRVPVRQWVLSFPRRLRFLAARDPAYCSKLLDLLTRAIFAWQRRRGRQAGVAKHARHSVALDGFSLHAGVRIHEHDRPGLEQLSRYAAGRPSRFTGCPRVLRGSCSTR
jgi:hypothetical protein